MATRRMQALEIPTDPGLVWRRLAAQFPHWADLPITPVPSAGTDNAIYTNVHFTLKDKPLRRSDLDDFVQCYQAGKRGARQESERFRRFAYEDKFSSRR
jgi:aminoglycoside phosphotransferase (APT) family kinase protein